jgi:hypothetical protein
LPETSTNCHPPTKSNPLFGRREIQNKKKIKKNKKKKKKKSTGKNEGEPVIVKRIELKLQDFILPTKKKTKRNYIPPFSREPNRVHRVK